jgi:hypothetical protein
MLKLTETSHQRLTKISKTPKESQEGRRITRPNKTRARSKNFYYLMNEKSEDSRNDNPTHESYHYSEQGLGIIQVEALADGNKSCD